MKLLSKLPVAVIAAVFLLANAASAATVMLNDGDTIDPVNVGTAYLYEETLTGTSAVAGSRSFTFVTDASDAPLTLKAVQLTLLGLTGDSITNPFMSWFDGSNTVFAAFQSIGGSLGLMAELDTVALATNLTNTLSFGWDGYSAEDGIQVSLEVVPVPVPAAGLLLLASLGGLGMLRRRKQSLI